MDIIERQQRKAPGLCSSCILMPGDTKPRHRITTSLALPPLVLISRHPDFYQSLFKKAQGPHPKALPSPNTPTLSPSDATSIWSKLIPTANSPIARSILSAAAQNSPVIVSVCVHEPCQKHLLAQTVWTLPVRCFRVCCRDYVPDCSDSEV